MRTRRARSNAHPVLPVLCSRRREQKHALRVGRAHSSLWQGRLSARCARRGTIVLRARRMPWDAPSVRRPTSGLASRWTAAHAYVRHPPPSVPSTCLPPSPPPCKALRAHCRSWAISGNSFKPQSSALMCVVVCVCVCVCMYS